MDCILCGRGAYSAPLHPDSYPSHTEEAEVKEVQISKRELTTLIRATVHAESDDDSAFE